MTKKNYEIKVYDVDGMFSSQAVRLDDEGLQMLQRGIQTAVAVSLDIWGGSPWTKQEALDEYAEHIGGESRSDLINDKVESVSDLELYEFMGYMTAEDAVEDAIDAEADDLKSKAIVEEERAKGLIAPLGKLNILSALSAATDQIVRDGEIIPEDDDDKSHRLTTLNLIQRSIDTFQDDGWDETRWTKQQAIDYYSDCLSEWKKQELIQHTVERITDAELKEFMDSTIEAQDAVGILIGGE